MTLPKDLVEAVARFIETNKLEEDFSMAALEIQHEIQNQKKRRRTAADEAAKFSEEFNGPNGVASLKFSNRAENALRMNGIATVEELRKHNRYTLRKLDGIGDLTADEIDSKIAKMFTDEQALPSK